MSDKWLDKIAALLTKAESSEFGPERDALREKADQLMVRYSIEAFQVETARRAQGQAPSMRPITQDIVIPWGHTSTGTSYAQGLYDLLLTVCQTVGVRTLYRSWGRDADGATGWRLTMIGFETDVKYVEMLFFSLRLSVLSMLEPQVSPTLSYDTNVFALRTAGVTWKEMARQLNKHVTVVWKDDAPKWYMGELREEDLRPKHILTQDGPWSWTSPYAGFSQLNGAYLRECDRLGVDRAAIPSAKSYQNTFLTTFRWRIRERMSAARSDETAALVLRSKQAEVDELYESMLPPPVEVKDDGKKRKRVARVKEDRWDAAGAAAGRAAADKVNLNRGAHINNAASAAIK